MIRIESYCRVKKGKLEIVNSRLFSDIVKELPDGNYLIYIEKRYNKRSNPQNAYLWGVVYPIIKDGLIDAGFDEFKQDHELEMTHELCKYRFLKRDLVSKDGEVIESLGSTRILRTTEFMEYLGSIAQWSAEYLQIFIPDPDPNYND